MSPFYTESSQTHELLSPFVDKSLSMLQASIPDLSSVWNWLREIIPVISPLITVLLTGVLVYLYRKQSEILDRQRELSEANQRALPRVLSYSLFSWRTLFQYEQEIEPLPDFPDHPDRYAVFIAYLTNPGKGFAEDLHIELQIESPNFLFSAAHPLARWTNTDQLMFNEKGGVIAPEENEVTMYTGSFWFTADDLPEEFTDSEISYESYITPSEALWLLDDLGESPVEIGLFLHYRDGTGVKDPIQLLTSEVELGSYDDVTEVWRRGSEPSGEMNPVFSLDQAD